MRIILLGDKEKAGGYLAWAKNELKKLKRHDLSLSGLKAFNKKFRFKNVNISLKSSFGLDTIRINAEDRGGLLIRKAVMVFATEWGALPFELTIAEGDMRLKPVDIQPLDAQFVPNSYFNPVFGQNPSAPFTYGNSVASVSYDNKKYFFHVAKSDLYYSDEITPPSDWLSLFFRWDAYCLFADKIYSYAYKGWLRIVAREAYLEYDSAGTNASGDNVFIPYSKDYVLGPNIPKKRWEDIVSYTIRDSWGRRNYYHQNKQLLTALEHCHKQAIFFPTITEVGGGIGVGNPGTCKIITDVVVINGEQIISEQPETPNRLLLFITDADISIISGELNLIGIDPGGNAIGESILIAGGGSTPRESVYAYSSIVSVTVGSLIGNDSADKIALGVKVYDGWTFIIAAYPRAEPYHIGDPETGSFGYIFTYVYPSVIDTFHKTTTKLWNTYLAYNSIEDNTAYANQEKILESKEVYEELYKYAVDYRTIHWHTKWDVPSPEVTAQFPEHHMDNFTIKSDKTDYDVFANLGDKKLFYKEDVTSRLYERRWSFKRKFPESYHEEQTHGGGGSPTNFHDPDFGVWYQSYNRDETNGTRKIFIDDLLIRETVIRKFIRREYDPWQPYYWADPAYYEALQNVRATLSFPDGMLSKFYDIDQEERTDTYGMDYDYKDKDNFAFLLQDIEVKKNYSTITHSLAADPGPGMNNLWLTRTDNEDISKYIYTLYYNVKGNKHSVELAEYTHYKKKEKEYNFKSAYVDFPFHYVVSSYREWGNGKRVWLPSIYMSDKEIIYCYRLEDVEVRQMAENSENYILHADLDKFVVGFVNISNREFRAGYRIETVIDSIADETSIELNITMIPGTSVTLDGSYKIFVVAMTPTKMSSSSIYKTVSVNKAEHAGFKAKWNSVNGATHYAVFMNIPLAQGFGWVGDEGYKAQYGYGWWFMCFITAETEVNIMSVNQFNSMMGMPINEVRRAPFRLVPAICMAETEINA